MAGELWGLLLRWLVRDTDRGVLGWDRGELVDSVDGLDGTLIGIGGDRGARVIGVVVSWRIETVATDMSGRVDGDAVRRR